MFLPVFVETRVAYELSVTSLDLAPQLRMVVLGSTVVTQFKLTSKLPVTALLLALKWQDLLVDGIDVMLE